MLFLLLDEQYDTQELQDQACQLWVALKRSTSSVPDLFEKLLDPSMKIPGDAQGLAFFVFSFFIQVW